MLAAGDLGAAAGQDLDRWLAGRGAPRVVRVVNDPHRFGSNYRVDMVIDGPPVAVPAAPTENSHDADVVSRSMFKPPEQRRDNSHQREAEAQTHIFHAMEKLPSDCLVAAVNEAVGADVLAIDHRAFTSRDGTPSVMVRLVGSVALDLKCAGGRSPAQLEGQRRVQLAARSRDLRWAGSRHVIVMGGDTPDRLSDDPDRHAYVITAARLLDALVARAPASARTDVERTAGLAEQLLGSVESRQPHSAIVRVEGMQWDTRRLQPVELAGKPVWLANHNDLTVHAPFINRKAAHDFVEGHAALCTTSEHLFAAADLLDAAWQQDLLLTPPVLPPEAEPRTLHGIIDLNGRRHWLWSRRQVQHIFHHLGERLPLTHPLQPFLPRRTNRPDQFAAGDVMRWAAQNNHARQVLTHLTTCLLPPTASTGGTSCRRD